MRALGEMEVIKRLVSLRGIGKLRVSKEGLEEAIEEAKKSLFVVKDVIRD